MNGYFAFKTDAIAECDRRAEAGHECYVAFNPDNFGERYVIVDDEDLDTFYNGEDLTIVYSYEEAFV